MIYLNVKPFVFSIFAIFTFQAIIHGLYTEDNNQKLNIGRAVKSIAIDPYHHKPGSGRKFIIGEWICVNKRKNEI